MTRADGTPAVLKVAHLHPENLLEAAALEHYAGAGAARLYESDPERGVILLERLEPGTPLIAVDEREAYAAVARLYPKLWRPLAGGHPFATLADEAGRWAVEFDAIPGEVAHECARLCRELGPTQGEQVLVDQDLHGENILSAEREPWLAIDPKPLAGEREFGTVAMIRDRRRELAREPHLRRRILGRLDLLAGELGLDRERMRGWCAVHTFAWGHDDPGMISIVRAVL